MPEVPFPRFPRSFVAGMVPFIVAGLIIFTSYPLTKVPFPHPVIFYLSLFFSVVAVTGVIGYENLVEELGFDVTQHGEKLEEVWWRYIVFSLFGFVFAYTTYKIAMSKTLGYSLIPLPIDFAIAHSLLAYPFVVSFVNWIVVALFEEIQRNAGSFIFANWLAHRFKLSKDASIVGGVFLGSVMFILLHTVAWSQTASLTSYIFGIFMAMSFSLLGYSLATRLLGPISFFEFSIVPGVVAHFTWDLLVDMNLRVLPGPLAMLALTW